ncbi:sorbosone dehydrogenase [Salinibacter sp. 10B]|uniref:PQQ-dependent sugar dehydrogenase n=1 Tax=Salinibacter sp. 10B TaxID=1923971 RepID=UPI000CF537E0|nr:PQQ-dependent sugar dehydrogenase [Salinibacter sp. 10B]PQJ36512.1 sorbosone dehydrogenase [Salinibacter sp. 10B]
MRRSVLLVLALFLPACGISIPDWGGDALSPDRITVPDGFRVEIFSDQLPEARSMALSRSGTLFVGSRDGGEVYALRDVDDDHRADSVYTIATGLNTPNGVAVRQGDLYVAEISRILRYENIDARLDDPPTPTVVSDAFPSDTHHGWKYIDFGPSDSLYVPVGAPCNICDEGDPYASIHRIAPDGSGHTIVARGVRNTVGFDWHPETGDLWFTDNGRDWLGDDRPPDELNRLTDPPQHFGYPYVHGDSLLDPEYGEGHDPAEYTAPVQELGPHVAALGMTFYTGQQFPEAYREQVFIAEHGSWNRSTKIGYRVTLVRLNDEGTAVGYEPFATGWLRNGDNWGRPVDVLQTPEGALLVSDDQTGTIYRISYEPL